MMKKLNRISVLGDVKCQCHMSCYIWLRWGVEMGKMKAQILSTIDFGRRI